MNIHLHQSQQDCLHCKTKSLCIVDKVGKEGIELLSSGVKQKSFYAAGEHIYNRATDFKSVYLVKRGALKSQTSNFAGDLNVTGFHFDGDIIGLEAIASRQYPCDVVAIKKSQICEIRYSTMEHLSASLPLLQKELMLRLSQRVLYSEYTKEAIRKENADNRVLHYLMSFYINPRSQRYIFGTAFKLPMTKADLSSYLGLRAETFSRTLSRLRAQGHINTKNDSIEIINLSRIREAIGL